MDRDYHGGSRTVAYQRWEAMIQRCTNPNAKQYSDYGGRGIKIHEPWFKFVNFLADMGQPPEKHSLDRINNDFSYSPDNCRWADAKTQHRNTRRNVFIEFFGERKCVAEWAEIYGLRTKTIAYRIKMNWPPEEILGIKKREYKLPKRAPKSDCRWIEFDGRKMIVSHWCAELGVCYSTFNRRVNRGLTDLQALGLESK